MRDVVSSEEPPLSLGIRRPPSRGARLLAAVARCVERLGSRAWGAPSGSTAHASPLAVAVVVELVVVCVGSIGGASQAAPGRVSSCAPPSGVWLPWLAVCVGGCPRGAGAGSRVVSCGSADAWAAAGSWMEYVGILLRRGCSGSHGASQHAASSRSARPHSCLDVLELVEQGSDRSAGWYAASSCSRSERFGVSCMGEVGSAWSRAVGASWLLPAAHVSWAVTCASVLGFGSRHRDEDASWGSLLASEGTGMRLQQLDIQSCGGG